MFKSIKKLLKSKPSVLLIDDDITIMKLVKIRLQTQEGVAVIYANCGEDGFQMAKNEPVDLILLDWRLPDVQGIDILKRLKATSATKNIPVVMLTGCNKIGEMEQALSLGATGYLTKPFELTKLGDKVSQVIYGETRDELQEKCVKT